MEELRAALINSILTLGRNNEETVRISQQLDVEIVKAMREQHYVNR